MKCRVPKPKVVLDIREVRKELESLKTQLLENANGREDINEINAQIEALNAQLERTERATHGLESVVQMPDGRKIYLNDDAMAKLMNK